MRYASSPSTSRRREDQVGGTRVPDDPRQEPRHARVGREVALEEHGAEAGLRRSHPQVAGERQAHAGAGGDAIDGGDRRLVETEHGHRLPAHPAELVHRVGFRTRRRCPGRRPRTGQVDARREPATHAGEYDGADVAVVLGLGQRRRDAVPQGRIQRVQPLRPVEREHEDVAHRSRRSVVVSVVGSRRSPTAGTLRRLSRTMTGSASRRRRRASSRSAPRTRPAGEPARNPRPATRRSASRHRRIGAGRCGAAPSTPRPARMRWIAGGVVARKGRSGAAAPSPTRPGRRTATGRSRVGESGSGCGGASPYPCPVDTPATPDGRRARLRLDALGDHDGADLAGEDHHRADQRPSRRVLVDVLGDRPVDLDDVGTQPDDVAERRVARAGVVDGEQHARLPQGLERARSSPGSRVTAACSVSSRTSWRSVAACPTRDEERRRARRQRRRREVHGDVAGRDSSREVAQRELDDGGVHRRPPARVLAGREPLVGGVPSWHRQSASTPANTRCRGGRSAGTPCRSPRNGWRIRSPLGQAASVPAGDVHAPSSGGTPEMPLPRRMLRVAQEGYPSCEVSPHFAFSES